LYDANAASTQRQADIPNHEMGTRTSISRSLIPCSALQDYFSLDSTFNLTLLHMAFREISLSMAYQSSTQEVSLEEPFLDLSAHAWVYSILVHSLLQELEWSCSA